MYSIRLDSSEEELYEKILARKCLVPEIRLYDAEYPIRGCDGKVRYKKMHPVLAGDYASVTSIACVRCKQSFRIDQNTGFPVMNGKECKYHRRRAWRDQYQCCLKVDPLNQFQCCSNSYHVHDGEQFKISFEDFVETQSKPEREPNKHGIFALDCEMCHTTVGLELARVTLINHNLKVVYDQLVRPKNPILDHNTKTSGIKPGDLDYVTTTLEDVQRDLLTLLSSKSILVGHSIDHDMLALKLIHKCFIDTSLLYVHPKGPRYKYGLAQLSEMELGETIRKGFGHDSNEDAVAAFKLAMKRINRS